MIRDSIRQASVNRIVFPLFGGALLGASIDSVQLLVSYFLGSNLEYKWNHSAISLFLVFLFSFLAWSLGLFVFSSPLWLVFHMAELRTWAAATALGFGLASIVSILAGTASLTGYSEGLSGYARGGTIWLDGALTIFGWQMAKLGAIELGVKGAIVRLLVWHLAYSKLEVEEKLN